MYNGILKGDKFNFIAVDNFTISVVNKASVVFLSHFHSDHYKGLSYDNRNDAIKIGNIFKNNPEKTVFCSEITKRIFESERNVLNFIPEKQIVGKPVGEPFVIAGPEKNDENESILVTVTLIPSGHILGAVMFLFEHECDRVLFTGDIRIYQDDIKKLKHLKDSNGDVKKITQLYLDTTFAFTEYPTFPLRSEISSVVIKMVTDWLSKSPKNEVHLNLPYKFAYESLMIDVSKGLNCKICIDPENYNSFYIYIPEIESAVFPASSYNGNTKFRIHATVGKQLCKICSCISSVNIKVIRPCAQYFNKSNVDKLVSTNSGGVTRVAYSAHCSLEELQAFVMYINPKEIYSICEHKGDRFDEVKKNIFSLIDNSCAPSLKRKESFDCETSLVQKTIKLIDEDDDDDNNEAFNSFPLDSPPW